MSTASSVPIWMTAVNAAPGSPQPNSSGKIRRCAELEIGRNSVSPWSRPRKTALRKSSTCAPGHSSGSLVAGRVQTLRAGAAPAARGPSVMCVADRRGERPPARRPDSVAPMQQRYLGRTGLKVSRLGLGTLTWGRDTDEHEARDQLVSFVDAGGTLLDTAAGYGDGASEELIGSLLGETVRRDDVVLATKAGISRARGVRETNVSRGYLISTLDASLKRLGVDHVDLWQVHTWADDTPLEETLERARLRGVERAGVVRRRLQLLRLAERPGRDLAARRPGSRHPRLHAGGVLPAQPQGRGRGAPGRLRARARRAAVVAARPRRADRQVPHRHAGGLPRRVAPLLQLRRQLPRRPQRADRGGGRPGGRRPRADARSRSPSPGCATVRA